MRESSLIHEDTITTYEKYVDDTENEEYKKLIESIEKYGGFYISEAELGYDANGEAINKYREMYSTKGTNELDYVTNGDYYRWEMTYEKTVEICKDLYKDSQVVESHLGYGLEYDATILYLLRNCEEVTAETIFNDSTSIGKYRYFTKEEDGQNSLWEKEFYLNGIYGLAGNLAEITQEKDGDNLILRGGSWATTGNHEPLSSKISIAEEEMDKSDNGEQIGSVGIRAYLYIKTEYDETEDIKEIAKNFEDDETKGLLKKHEDYKSTWEKEYNEKKEEIEKLILGAKTKKEALTLKKEQNEKLRYWFITTIRPIIEEQMRLESINNQRGARGDVPAYTWSGVTKSYDSNGRTFTEYKQVNPLWSSKPYGKGTIGGSGCTVASIAIVASGYGYTYTPANYSSYSYVRVINEVQKLLPNSALYITTATEEVNITQAPKSWDITAIKNHLRTGEPVIIHVLGSKYGYNQHFTGNQHWMALLDIEENANKTQVYVSDPNGESKLYDIEEVLQALCCYILVKGPTPEVAKVAEEFYNTAPVSWDYYNFGEAEYISWKKAGKELIRKNAGNEKHARQMAKDEMKLINTWIENKIQEAKKIQSPAYKDISTKLDSFVSKGIMTSWGYVDKNGNKTDKKIEIDKSEIIYFNMKVCTGFDKKGNPTFSTYMFVHVDGPIFVMRRPIKEKSSEISNWKDYAKATKNMIESKDKNAKCLIGIKNNTFSLNLNWSLLNLNAQKANKEVKNFLEKNKNSYGIYDYKNEFRLIFVLE